MEIIEEINESSFGEGDWSSYSGFIIKTNKQLIEMGISNEQSCCENWGYFMTNDYTQEFIGAEILEVKIVDQCLNVAKAPDVYEGSVMFVNIETSKGTLQFTAYNEHNGYYSHDAVVKCEQLNVSESL